MAERKTHYPLTPYPMTAYFSYASLTTPGHNDIEVITAMLCTLIPVDRIAVHAQTVNVSGLTNRERAQISMLDTAMANDCNLMSTDLQ